MLFGVIDQKKNDFLLILGFVSCTAMPLMGVYDVKNYWGVHCNVANITFISTCFYMGMVGRNLYFNRDKFPEAKQRTIRLTMFATYGLFLTLAS